MKNALMGAFAAGGLLGAVLIGAVAATYTRLTRSRADLRKARGDVTRLRGVVRSQVGELLRGLAVIALVLVLAGVVYLVGAR